MSTKHSVIQYRRYLVPVSNEITGEMILHPMESIHPTDAQVEALGEVFHGRGWRKTRSHKPLDMEEMERGA